MTTEATNKHAERFSCVMQPQTADLIARHRPCPDAFTFEPPSESWIDENEANWLNVRDEDIDYMIEPRRWPASRCPYCDGFLVHGDDCKALRDGWIPKLEFGKHRGRRLDQVPEDYLRWLLKSDAIKDADTRESALAVLGIPEPIKELAA